MKIPGWLKPTLDLLLLVDFIIEGVSGIALYLAPNGRIARETSWTFLGLNKDAWEGLHIYFGFAMIALVALHIAVNFRPMVAMIKSMTINRREKRIKWGSLAALVIVTVVFIVGGIVYTMMTGE